MRRSTSSRNVPFLGCFEPVFSSKLYIYLNLILFPPIFGFSSWAFRAAPDNSNSNCHFVTKSRSRELMYTIKINLLWKRTINVNKYFLQVKNRSMINNVCGVPKIVLESDIFPVFKNAYAKVSEGMNSSHEFQIFWTKNLNMHMSNCWVRYLIAFNWLHWCWWQMLETECVGDN